jgi:hypothetical protein
MDRYVLPPGRAAATYRVDTVAGTTTPAAIAATSTGLPLIDRAILHADPVTGALPAVYGSGSTLYLKEIRYDGVTVGAAVAVLPQIILRGRDDLEALVAILSSRFLVAVDVVNPTTDARPGAARVVWVGGTVRPTNMAPGDLWIKETAAT